MATEVDNYKLADGRGVHLPNKIRLPASALQKNNIKFGKSMQDVAEASMCGGIQCIIRHDA